MHAGIVHRCMHCSTIRHSVRRVRALLARNARFAAQLCTLLIFLSDAHAMDSTELYILLGIPVDRESHNWSLVCKTGSDTGEIAARIALLTKTSCAQLHDQPWRYRELNDQFAGALWNVVLCEEDRVKGTLERRSFEPFGRFCNDTWADGEVRAIRWVELQIRIECVVYEELARPVDDPWWLRWLSQSTETDDLLRNEARTINELCHEFRREHLDALDTRFKIRTAKSISLEELEATYYQEIFGRTRDALGSTADFLWDMVE